MFKSIVYLLFPYQVCIELLVIGLILLWTDKFKKIGKYSITLSVIAILIFSNGFVSNYLIKNLESKHPPLKISIDNINQFKSIKYIVVLGAAPNYIRKYPITSQVGATGMLRLAEGIRLYRSINGAKLILSGTGRIEISEAELMYNLAVDLGVNKEDIILEKESRNTYEEAKYIKDIVGKNNFILTTSAIHMPRAMALFEKFGMGPVPGPTAHVYRNKKGSVFSLLLPNPGNMSLMNSVMYEYYGQVKARLLGRI